MTHYTCPTVLIKTAAGPVRINESDFDPKLHERDDTPLPPPPPSVLPPPPPVQQNPLDALSVDWREAPASKLKALAQGISGRNPEDKKQAVTMIEQALAARKGAQ